MRRGASGRGELAAPDSTGSGGATITLNTAKDSAGNITAATADFQVNTSGFPAGTTLTGAHVHPGTASRAF